MGGEKGFSRLGLAAVTLTAVVKVGWGGRLVIVGGTVESMAGRGPPHTHEHKYKYRLAPSLCPLRSGDRPSSCALLFPRGGQTCCAIRSSSSPLSPPPSSLSRNLIISHAPVSPLLPSCSTATPPGLGILKLFCWFQACDLPQKVSLQTDPMNPFFPFSFLSLFSLTIQTWFSLSCQEILHRNEAGCVFCAKARSFQWQYCCRYLDLVWEHSVRSEFSLHAAFKDTKATNIRQRLFISNPFYSLLSMRINCTWKFLIPAPSQIETWNKCKWVFSLPFFIMISHRVRTAWLYLNMNPWRWLLPS